LRAAKVHTGWLEGWLAENASKLADQGEAR
jgi:hypothetical protein